MRIPRYEMINLELLLANEQVLKSGNPVNICSLLQCDIFRTPLDNQKNFQEFRF